MRGQKRRVVAGALPLLLLLAPGAAPAVASGLQVLRQVAYVEDPADAAAQSLDLYLPEGSAAPLVVFVHSRFWRETPDERFLDARLARPLQRAGAAVAVVRHRLAPAAKHPAHAEDVAAALAFLLRNAARWGYDPQRVILMGHSSGGQLAALLALDPAYLAAWQLEPAQLAGVVVLSGIFELDPGDTASEEERELFAQAFGGKRERRAASPLRLVRGDAPRFLVLAAAGDIPGYAEAGEAFVAALRERGHADSEFRRVPGRDHTTILDLVETGSGAAPDLLHFAGLSGLSPELAALDASRSHWSDPRFSSEPFRERGVVVKTYPADARFLEETRRLFAGRSEARDGWSPARFHAIDLFGYLAAADAAQTGTGSWLTLTNVLMEKSYLELEEIRPQRPVVVVGVDELRNLFTVTDVTWEKLEYTWLEDRPRPPPVARPMGAFLYFLEPPEKPLLPPTLAHFSLVEKSFSRTQEDPLAPIRDLDPALQEVLTTGSGCIHCHQFRGVGSNAGHLRLVDAGFQGGFALPLTKYPPSVWRRYVFEPDAVAEAIGTAPIRVPPEVAQQLHDLIARERESAEGG